MFFVSPTPVLRFLCALLETFLGMFREGEKHGSGSLLTAEGDTLEGEWVKSRPQEGDVRTRQAMFYFVADFTLLSFVVQVYQHAMSFPYLFFVLGACDWGRWYFISQYCSIFGGSALLHFEHCSMSKGSEKRCEPTWCGGCCFGRCFCSGSYYLFFI